MATTPASLLSIINKFAVLHFPYPAALTGFQYAVSALSVVVLCVPSPRPRHGCSGARASRARLADVTTPTTPRSLGGWVEPVNLLDYHSVRQMFPVLLTFYGSVYSNMKARGAVVCGLMRLLQLLQTPACQVTRRMRGKHARTHTWAHAWPPACVHPARPGAATRQRGDVHRVP